MRRSYARRLGETRNQLFEEVAEIGLAQATQSDYGNFAAGLDPPLRKGEEVVMRAHIKGAAPARSSASGSSCTKRSTSTTFSQLPTLITQGVATESSR